MKNLNIPRIVWVSCLFLDLIVILVMVIDYKVNYQYMVTHSLYFYDCDGNLCVSEATESDKIYSTYLCGNEMCPVYEKTVEDDYAILNSGESAILYNYKVGKVISKGYDSYEFINSNYVIVTKNKYKGVIDLEDEVTVKVLYQDIGVRTSDYVTGYNVNNIIAKRSDKYGIISFKDGSIVEDFKYSEDKLPELLNIIKQDSEVSL